jgi:enoyl-CoA hydratase/carnithine racemase
LRVDCRQSAFLQQLSFHQRIAMSLITTENKDGVLFLGFNRPDKKNAITLDMYRAITVALKSAQADDTVRVVLVHGSPDTFTSGNDLADFLSEPMDEKSPIPAFLEALSHFEKPIVAAVNGPAIGIGTTMLLHCDLVYADTTAKLSVPFINLGAVPEGGSSYLMPRIMGNVRAAELLLLGETFNGQKAKEYGLVNDVVEPGKLMETATAAARKLAQRPPAALRITKSLLKRWNRETLDKVIPTELELFAQQLRSPEAKEAMTAFFEKRKPDFSGFK